MGARKFPAKEAISFSWNAAIGNLGFFVLLYIVAGTITFGTRWVASVLGGALDVLRRLPGAHPAPRYPRLILGVQLR